MYFKTFIYTTKGILDLGSALAILERLGPGLILARSSKPKHFHLAATLELELSTVM